MWYQCINIAYYKQTWIYNSLTVKMAEVYGVHLNHRFESSCQHDLFVKRCLNIYLNFTVSLKINYL